MLLKSLKERGVVEIEPVSGRENRVMLVMKGMDKEAEKKPEEIPEKKEDEPAPKEGSE